MNKYYSFNNFDNYILDYHNDVINFFKNIDINNIPNIIIYGSNGCGKKSMIYSFLKLKEKNKTTTFIKINSKIQEINYFRHDNIIELDISDFGSYKINIFKNFIRELINIKNINGNKKIFIIHNINTLTTDDQYILRKIIEDYMYNSVFLMISNTINNIMKPILSRCITIKLKTITNDIIEKKLIDLYNLNNININKEEIDFILEKSNNNLKFAIFLLEEIMNYDFDMVKKIHNNENIILNELYHLILDKHYNHENIEKKLYDLLIIHKMNFHNIIYKLYKSYFVDNKNTLDLFFEYNAITTNTKREIIYLQDFILKLRKII